MSVEAIQFAKVNPLEINETQIEEIALLIARANAQRDGTPLGTIDIDGLTRRLNESYAWTDIATCGQEVAGFALGYPRVESPNTEYLSLLMVDPDYWSMRIGRTLLDRCVDRSRTAGREQVTLRTREADNERAREVYEKYGFVLSGHTKESQYGRQVEYQLNLSEP